MYVCKCAYKSNSGTSNNWPNMGWTLLKLNEASPKPIFQVFFITQILVDLCMIYDNIMS